MANTDPLVPIRLFNATTETQPILNNTAGHINQTLCLSVRGIDPSTTITYVVETNPVRTADTADWISVLWEDGTPVVFNTNGDAVLPACNQHIRIRAVGGIKAGTDATLF
jgi:hypothetical protein